MTAAGLHHLPPDDPAPVRMVLETLARLGVTPTEGQKRTLAVAHSYGWLLGEDGIAKILADGSPAARAARSRRRLREAGLAEAERRHHASLPRSQDTRLWSPTEDGFTCHLCDLDFGRYVDPAQAASAAVDHTKTCEGGASDV